MNKKCCRFYATVLFGLLMTPIAAFMVKKTSSHAAGRNFRHGALSEDYLENDILGIKIDEKPPRLCVVRPDHTVSPLCQHEDDVETDLFADPREEQNDAWISVSDTQISGTYGEGWYGQRPVPSLGGGPGYGAEADEIWSISEDTLESISDEGVELPVLDVGIAHGEKARGGSLF